MALGDNKKNNNEEVSCNTKGVQLFNKDGFDPSTLVLSYWNRFCRIVIHPALPPNKQTEKMVYDYDKKMVALLTVEKVYALFKEIEDRLIPAMTKNPNSCKEVGVPTTGNGYIGVGNGLNYVDKISPYLVIKEIDPDNGKTLSEICYEFKEVKTIINLNSAQGAYDTSFINAEFAFFIEYLRQSFGAMTYAQAHVMRDAEKYRTERQKENIFAIMTALDIGDLAGNNNNGKNSGGGFFSKNRSNTNMNNIETADTINADSIENVEKELSALN